MEYPVAINVLAIPDGLDALGNLRLTVQVSPYAGKGSGAQFALAEWPNVIAKAAQRMVVEFAQDVAIPEPPVTCTSALSDYFLPGGILRPEPKALWDAIFDGGQFDSLHQAVTIPASGRPLSPLACIHTSDLSAVMHALSDPLPIVNADTLSAFQERRVTLLNDWLGPIIQAGAVSRTLKDIDEARQRMQNTAERSQRLSELLPAIQNHLAGVEPLPEEQLTTLRGVLGNILHGLGMDKAAAKQRQQRKVGQQANVSPIDLAKHRLQAIQCIPSLAHYLSLSIQLRLSIKDIPAYKDGLLRVKFVDSLAQNSSWTAFEFSRDRSSPAYFGPRADLSAGAYRYKLREGLLWLAEPDRFRLDTIDAVNMLFRAMQSRMAEPKNDTVSKLDRIRRGFALMDRKKKDHDEEQSSKECAEKMSGFSPEAIFYADDLLIGFRPDVAVDDGSSSGLKVSAERWRPLTRRKITCEGPHYDSTFPSLAVMQDIAHHQHGWTVSPRDRTTTHEDLFTWAGGSLAVAAQAGVAEKWKAPPQTVLGLRVTYELDKGDASQNLPPLREDHAYVVGCRAAYLGGTGPTFESARSQYAVSDGVVIGDGLEKPMVFPLGSTQPCSVHFLKDDPLVKEVDVSAFGSESLTRMVIRSSETKTKRIRRRALLPARIDFDAAELERQFDTPEQTKLSIPLGICSQQDPLWLRLFEESGQLPEARAGRLWRQTPPPVSWVDLENGDVVTETDLPSLRGTVALFSEAGAATKRQFYASRHGRVVELRLDLTTAGGQGSVPVMRSIEFWEDGGSVRDGTPTIIELTATGADAQQDSVEWGKFNPGGKTVPLLRVKLRPASSAHLVLNEKRPDIAGEEVIRTQTLELIHAVAKPLRPPTVPSVPAKTRRGDPLGVHAVTLPPGKSVEDSNTQWEQYVGKPPVPSMLQWPSKAEGTVTYFVGALSLDRPSTGRLAVTMKWEEFDESRVVRNPAVHGAADIIGGQKAWIHCVNSRSEQWQEMEVGEHGDVNAVSLLYDESTLASTKLRRIKHTFNDGRARKLRLTAVAKSRFAHCFAKTTDTAVSQPFLTTVWTACTFRPPPPRLEVITTDLSWMSEWKATKGPRVINRTNRRLRIHLDAGWYASGEGEQLGILLKPEDLAEADIPESHRPYLSRFARDPVRMSPVAGDGYLRQADVAGSQRITHVDVVISKPEAALRAKANAVTPLFPLDVIALTPEIDELTGGLVCDIELSELVPDASMLHLGLVRFQPHAVTELRASPPIVEVIYLQPNRKLVVRTGSANKPGDSQYRSITLHTPEQRGAPGMPHVPREMEVRLLLRNANHGWDQWRPTDGTVAHFRQILPSVPHYTFTVKLPRQTVPVAIMIEEYELLPSDAPAQTIARPLQPAVERRPLFWFLVHVGTQDRPA